MKYMEMWNPVLPPLLSSKSDSFSRTFSDIQGLALTPATRQMLVEFANGV